MSVIEIKVPDIGDFEDVPVIEILVTIGDEVEAEQGLVTVESDKATMDIPSPHAGKIASIAVAIGDHVRKLGNAAGLVFVVRPAKPDVFKHGKGGRVVNRAQNLALKIGNRVD